MLGSFVKADLICRRAGRHFTVGEQQLFAKYVEEGLLLNNALAVWAANRNLRLYKILPKHHAMLHLGLDTFTNPRLNCGELPPRAWLSDAAVTV
jgi:hypothetical protein